MTNLFLSIILLFSAPISTPEDAMVPANDALIVVVNTASWCPVCQKNGPRVEKELLSDFMKNDSYQIIVNDMSDESTIMKANEKLSAAGIADFATEHKGTGVIYFIHPESKEVLDKISVRKSTEKIKAAFESALSEI